MPRIIAGSLGGRRLAIPSKATRPSSDRLREALFSSLGAERTWCGLRILDLYAGSGALALEGLSRGGADAVLVDRSRSATVTCRRNAERLGLVDRVEIRRSSVERLVAAPDPHGAVFDLVFADPPYDLPRSELDQVCVALAREGWLADGARVILERRAGTAALEWPDGYGETRTQVVGGAVLHRAVWYGPVVTKP